MEHTAREGVNKFLGYKVELRSVSKNGRILLANPEISFYCTIERSLVDSTKTNNKIRMAGVYVHSDVCCEAYFLAICYKKLFM